MKSGPIRLSDAEQTLPPREPGSRRYVEPFTHGSMRLGLYAPVATDPQRPHEQDELYFVTSGSGTFRHGGESCRFGPGDALFVAAGVEHRFEEFSEDFEAWVVFWGPPGGE